MIITKNLKNKIKKAIKKGYKTMIISRAYMHGNTAYSVYTLDYLLNQQIGEHVREKRGRWVSKNWNPVNEEATGYLELFRKF